MTQRLFYNLYGKYLYRQKEISNFLKFENGYGAIVTFHLQENAYSVDILRWLSEKTYNVLSEHNNLPLDECRKMLDFLLESENPDAPSVEPEKTD